MSPEELSPVGCNVQNAGAQPGSGHLSGLFTRTEMFAAIRERGLVPPTPRAFQDWVERGLLDRAAVHQGAGRNHGKQKGRWPGTQLELLALIVTKRIEVGDRRGTIGLLANIPTLLWLNWGDAYVPVRQVRRALATWGEAFRSAQGWDKVTAETRRTARMIKDPKARQRDASALGDLLAGLSFNGTTNVDAAALELAARVIDPEGEGREFGAPGASLDPYKLLGMFVTMQHGVGRVIDDGLAERRGSSKQWFSDHAYYNARSQWAISHQEYRLMQPLLRVAGPAHVYEPLTDSDLLNQACRHLVQLLAVTDSRRPHPRI